MAFFSSQKERKVNSSHSTERIKTHLAGPIASKPLPAVPFPLVRTRSFSRPTIIYDAHVQGIDPEPSTAKLNTTTSTPRQSPRRIPVPSLSIQDLDIVPYDHPRTSPIISSSRSTSISRKSSIADIGGASNATTKADHLKSPANTRISTPPHSSNQWESSSGSFRNPGGACNLKKTSPPTFDLSILVSSSKQVTTSMPPPNSASQKPQRAVLRRKSSARRPKSQPTTPSLTHQKSEPDLGISPVTATPQRIVSPATRSPHVVSTPLSLNAARRSTSDERKPRSPGNLSPPLSPKTLTPAGAVAAAYKELEKRRKDLKDFVRANTNDLSRRDSGDENGGAYYTVFGSSGKVVAVGAPEHESLSHYDLSNCTPNKPKTVSRKPSLGAFSRLHRKSSTKIKNEAGSACGITSESECGHERITRDEEVGRSSFQGRRSTSLPSKHRSKEPFGIPIDNSEVGQVWDSPQSPSTSSKSAGGPMDDPSPSTGGKIWKLMKRISTGGLRDKYHAQEAAPPVPALPEGLLPTPLPQLKSKIHSVPHSPSDSKSPISHSIRGRSSFGDAPFSSRHRNVQGVPSPVPSHRPPTLSSGKNPSHRRPSTNTRSSSPVSSDKASSKYWQKSRSSSVSTFEEMPPLPGRVMKSGPILSPLELYRLEKERATAELPSPPSTVDSHSLTPSPSNHHGNTVIIIRKPSLRGLYARASREDSETDGMGTSEFAALPTPPRHHYRPNPHVIYHQPNDNGPIVGSVSTSPTIPMFSTQDVVNRFHPAKGSGVGVSRSLNSSLTSQSAGMSSNEFGVTIPTQPPPRPQRSDKRKPVVMNKHVTTRVSQDRERDGHHGRPMLSPISASRSKEGTLGASSGPDDDEDGRSCGTFGSSQSKGLVELVITSRDSSSSREDLKLSSSIHSRSPLRFREVGSGERVKDRKVLTEKEKADRWDDLLKKSNRAGGTIHIGNTKLLSDSLRFSDYSTPTASAL